MRPKGKVKAVYTLGGVLLFVAFGTMTTVISHSVAREANRTIRTNQIKSCRAEKKDRAEDVQVYVNLVHYYAGVIAAKSVKADVRGRAKTVRLSMIEAARGKRDRIWLCVPRVDRNVEIPDKKALARLPAIPQISP